MKKKYKILFFPGASKRGAEALPRENDPDIYDNLDDALLKLGKLYQEAQVPRVSGYGIVDAEKTWPYVVGDLINVD